MRSLLGIALIFFSLSLAAQVPVPGYQGKKVNVLGNFSFFSSYQQPNANGESGILAFNTRYGLEVNIARSRDLEFCLSYDYFTTKTEIT